MSRVPGERLYRLLLRLHPRPFRARYDASLIECFRDAWHTEAAGGGMAAAFRFWWNVLRGTLATAWRQRFEPRHITDTTHESARPTMKGSVARLDAALQDMRFGLRMLRRSPGFALAVLGTLSLSIGAATAVFTLVDGVLLQPLPFPQPDRLFTVSQDGEDGSYWFSAPNYFDMKQSLDGLVAAGAYSPDGANMMVDGEPARVSVAETDADFFRALAIQPQLGRVFTEEERAANAPVVVISHGLWQQRFGARPDVLGSTITLDGMTRDVIGVMPPGTMVPAGAEIWAPLRFESPDWRTRRGISWIRVLARIAPHADIANVRAQAANLSTRLRDGYPENRSFEIGLRSLEEATVGPVRAQMRTLLAAVALMLLVAAINVGGLLVARATARRDELSVRAALGGGPRRLIGQLFTESTVLALLGVAAGLFIGRIGVTLLLAVAPPGTPRLAEVSLGSNGLLFAAAAGVVGALLFGLLPALTAQHGTATVLRATRSGGTRAAMRLRDALVVSQVALALALLFGAGLLARSFWQLQQVELGIEPDNVLVAGLPVGDAQFETGEAREAHFLRLLERASALPGVRSAALTNAAPFASFGPVFSYELPDVPEATGVEKLVRFRVATSDVFTTLGIPLVRGRVFSATSGRSGPKEAVVSEELTARWFPGRDPLGATVLTAGDTFAIVGVVAAVRDASPRQASPFPHLYINHNPTPRQQFSLLLRTAGDPAALAEPLRAAIREVAPAQPVTPLRPLPALIADTSARDRFTLVLLAFFATSAVFLAGLGLYGVLAYAVSRRTREIGVRVALGAPVMRVRALVVRRGIGLTVLGLGIGMLLALWGGRFLESMLFQVDARDPLVLIVVQITLLAVAVIAAWLPARRATRIAPVEALRVE